MSKYYNNYKSRFVSLEPKVITCKFDSICKETGKTIKKGEQALYYPSDKSIYILDSKQAQEFRENQFDEALQENSNNYGY